MLFRSRAAVRGRQENGTRTNRKHGRQLRNLRKKGGGSRSLQTVQIVVLPPCAQPPRWCCTPGASGSSRRAHSRAHPLPSPPRVVSDPQRLRAAGAVHKRPGSRQTSSDRTKEDKREEKIFCWLLSRRLRARNFTRTLTELRIYEKTATPICPPHDPTWQPQT